MVYQPEKIKAVIFDWGGVCATPAEPFALPALQSKLGMNVDEIAEALRELYNDYYKGKYAKEIFWPLVLGHFGLKEDNKINVESLNNAYLNSYQLYPEILDRAKELSKQGYKVSLLSNLTLDMRDHIRQAHHLSEVFMPDTYSCDADVKMIKPERGIYEIALMKIALPPDNCLFIDDTKKNTDAAEALGIESILAKDPKQCLQDISVLL